MVVQEEIQKLNRKILNKLENEVTVFKDNHPHLQLEVDNMYKRLRKGILDDIGEIQRGLDAGN